MAMEISIFTLRELPAAQFGLPFLLIFALVYGALTSAGTFKENRAVNVLISLVISFFAITYEPLITGIWDNMPLLIGLLFVVFAAVIVKRAIAKVKVPGEKKGPPSPEKFLAFIIISIVILLAIGGFREPVRKALDMEQEAANSLFFIIGLVFFIILIWAVIKYWSEQSRAAAVARAYAEEMAKKQAAQKQQQQG